MPKEKNRKIKILNCQIEENYKIWIDHYHIKTGIPIYRIIQNSIDLLIKASSDHLV